LVRTTKTLADDGGTAFVGVSAYIKIVKFDYAKFDCGARIRCSRPAGIRKCRPIAAAMPGGCDQAKRARENIDREFEAGSTRTATSRVSLIGARRRDNSREAVRRIFEVTDERRFRRAALSLWNGSFMAAGRRDALRQFPSSHGAGRVLAGRCLYQKRIWLRDRQTGKA